MWSLGGIRIYAQDHNGSGNQTIVRLQPLVGGSVTQVFGYEDPIYKLQGIVVGDDNLASIQGFYQDGNAHELIGNDIDTASYLVKHFAFSRRMVVCQTIDPNQATDAPVYDVDLELW